MSRWLTQVYLWKESIVSVSFLIYRYMYRGGNEGVRRRKALKASPKLPKASQRLPKDSPNVSQSSPKPHKVSPKPPPESPRVSQSLPKVAPRLILRLPKLSKPPQSLPKPPQKRPKASVPSNCIELLVHPASRSRPRFSVAGATSKNRAGMHTRAQLFFQVFNLFQTAGLS